MPEHGGKCLTHQRTALHIREHFSGVQIYKTGGQHHLRGEGADHDGIGKDFKDAPHTLLHRLLDVGGRVHHDGRAKARFIGEGTALEAPGDGLRNAVAQHTAACRFHGECALENGNERRRDRRDVGTHNAQSTQNVQHGHKRHHLFGDRRHTLQTTQDDQGREHHQCDARDAIGQAECTVHVARDRIDLTHVADAKAGQHAEAGEQHRQHPAQRLAALFAAQAVGQIVHGTAGPLAVRIFAAVEDAQHVFGIVGHHAQDGHDPHPEDRARSAGDDGGGHTHDVSGADGRRQGGAQALELADGPVFLGGMRRDLLVGKDGTDGVLHPVAKMADLEKSGPDGHEQADAKQQRQPHRPPDHTVDHLVDPRNGFQHLYSSSEQKMRAEPAKALPAWIRFGFRTRCAPLCGSSHPFVPVSAPYPAGIRCKQDSIKPAAAQAFSALGAQVSAFRPGG